MLYEIDMSEDTANVWIHTVMHHLKPNKSVVRAAQILTDRIIMLHKTLSRSTTKMTENVKPYE